MKEVKRCSCTFHSEEEKRFERWEVWGLCDEVNGQGLRVNDLRASFFNTVSHNRVVRKSIQIEDAYSQYLCFNIIMGSNNLIPQMEYSDHQQENHALVYDILK